MKKQALNLFIIVLCILVVSGCSIKKMVEKASEVKYKVTPGVLEMHANKVDVKINITFPPKYFNKKAVLEITPYIKYESGERLLPTIMLQGEDVLENYTKIMYETGGSFDYEATFPYEEAMRVSELRVKVIVKAAGQELNIPDIKIADGIITTPTLVITQPQELESGQFGGAGEVILAEYIETGLSPDKVVAADIHFKIQMSDIRNTETKANDIIEIKDFIKMVAADENMEFKKVEILAYASPDGSFDMNENLSSKRAAVAEKFIAQEFKKAKVSKAKEAGFYLSKFTPEDWEGFKTELEKSNLADKAAILRILNTYSDPIVREAEIKKMAAAYDELAEVILPILRRSIMKITVSTIRKTDEQVLNLALNSPAELGVEELLYAATLTNDMSKRLSIYTSLTNNTPKCWRGFNNKGYILFKQNNVNEAKQAFLKAESLAPGNTYVLNNLGVVALAQGNIEEAKTYFQNATALGSEVNQNLGIVNIQQGDYAAAVQNFGSACIFNAALAQVLNKQYDKAKNTLTCSNSTSANSYYLKAIIGARTNDTGMIFENLRAAIQKDASYKNYAKKDFEFGAYFINPAFLEILGE